MHTGVQTTMTFLPAKPNHGIKFQRVDLPGSPIIDADCDNVVDVSRGTTIEQSGARVSTIEHSLAALVGLEIDNVLIQLDGPEAPIMDGSSMPFVQALHEAGAEEQNALRDFFEVDAKHIAFTTLYALYKEGNYKLADLKKAMSELDINPEKLNPMIS